MMNSLTENILEVVLSIVLFALFFFLYAAAERLLRPHILRDGDSTPSPGASVCRMAASFSFYIALPNVALAGSLTALFVLDDLHFAVSAVLVGAVAASLAVIVLVVYGMVGSRADARVAEGEARRQRARAELRRQQERMRAEGGGGGWQTNTTGLSVVYVEGEEPLPSYDQLDGGGAGGSNSDSSGSVDGDYGSTGNTPPPTQQQQQQAHSKQELPPSYLDVVRLWGDKQTEKKRKKERKVDIDRESPNDAPGTTRNVTAEETEEAPKEEGGNQEEGTTSSSLSSSSSSED